MLLLVKRAMLNNDNNENHIGRSFLIFYTKIFFVLKTKVPDILKQNNYSDIKCTNLFF